MRKLWLLSLVLILLANCKEAQNNEELKAKAKEEVLKKFNAMWVSYAKGGVDFFDYYEDDLVRVTENGEITIGKEKHKEEWDAYFNEGNSVELIKYDEPTLVTGQDLIITINHFEELFITNNGADTTLNKGVYIIGWKKQSDNTWEISMDTWHAGLD